MTSDPMLDGVLVTIAREGETSRPDIEAIAVALGFAYRSKGRLYLTKAGRARIADVV